MRTTRDSRRVSTRSEVLIAALENRKHELLFSPGDWCSENGTIVSAVKNCSGVSEHFFD